MVAQMVDLKADDLAGDSVVTLVGHLAGTTGSRQVGMMAGRMVGD